MFSPTFRSSLLTVLFLFSSLWVRAERYYLSGQDSASAIPWDFKVSTGARAGEWAKLPVPSNWEMHGFGTLSYHSAEPAETGSYRHRFPSPPALEGKRVFLVFEGVMTDATVRLNGHVTGAIHQGGFYRFKYEVTEWLVKEGENVLEVDVSETSSNEGVNRAERTGDYWNFGGIFRPVWLDVVPEAFIERIAVDARADGALSVEVSTHSVPKGYTVQARVASREGELVGQTEARGVQGEVTYLTGAISSVKPWSAETPQLYHLEVELRGKGGESIHKLDTKIGFRTFEVREGDGFYLNGRRIVLQGANRHSFNAHTARALNESDHRTDIELLKGMNMNAVRMSHYPPDPRFLELCDELGLYVLNELAGWQKAYDTEVGRRLVEEMVKRDVNHPSILFWDNGNEGGWNTELDREFTRWDPQGRSVLHPWEKHSGVNTAHYKVFAHTRALAQGYTTKSWGYDPKEVPERGDVPFIYMPTEFLHGLFDGGIGAGMEDYWSLMRKSPVFGGGFVWSFRDEGVQNPFTGQLDLRGNLAPDGVVGPLGEKEGSYFSLKELWSPLVVTGSLPRDGDTLLLDVENRYSFRNADQCRYEWSLKTFPVGHRDGETGVRDLGEAGVFPPIAAGEQGLLSLRLPDGWRNFDVLAFTSFDAEGRELWTETWRLPGVKRLASTPAASTPTKRLNWQVIPIEGGTVVKGDNLEVAFDTVRGRLMSLRSGTLTTSLRDGPRTVEGDSRLLSQEGREDGDSWVVHQRFSGSLREVVWRLHPDGALDCDYIYNPVGDGAAQGVLFDLAENEVRAKEWVGQGPYRVWANRRTGTNFGYWKNEYNDTITGWSGWIYPEFKGFFEDVQWLALDSDMSRLEVSRQAGAPYLQVLTPKQAPPEILAETRVGFPAAGLGFLDRIPAIGTKFNRPELLGPQSELKPLPEVIHGRVSFRLVPRAGHEK